MRRTILLAAALVGFLDLIGPNLSAWGDELGSFRGVEFGKRIVEQLPKCPERYADESTTCWNPEALCASSKYAAPCGTPAMITFHDSIESMAIGALVSTDSEGRPGQLSFRMGSENFAEVERLFVTKYGKPKLSKAEPWQSKGGVSTTAQVRLWKWKGLTISVRSIDEKVGTGSVIVSSDTYLADAARDDAEKTRKQADDL